MRGASPDSSSPSGSGSGIVVAGAGEGLCGRLLHFTRLFLGPLEPEGEESQGDSDNLLTALLLEGVLSNSMLLQP